MGANVGNTKEAFLPYCFCDITNTYLECAPVDCIFVTLVLDISMLYLWWGWGHAVLWSKILFDFTI